MSLGGRKSGEEGGIEAPIGDGEVRCGERWYASCYQHHFSFERIVSVSAGPKEFKSTRSSSKSSSKTDCSGGSGFFKTGELQYRPPRPRDGRKLAQSSIQHTTAFSGRAPSNGASNGLPRNRNSERPKAIKAHSQITIAAGESTLHIVSDDEVVAFGMLVTECNEVCGIEIVRGPSAPGRLASNFRWFATILQDRAKCRISLLTSRLPRTNPAGKAGS